MYLQQDDVIYYATSQENWFDSFMKEFISTLTTKGQAPIPATIRTYLV
jgi:hypothetical protein